MKKTFNLALLTSALLLQISAHAGELTLYEDAEFRGRAGQVVDRMDDLSQTDFNDMTSSLVVHSGRWLICTDAYFRGFCQIYRPGEYSWVGHRFNDRISSMRDLDN